ncbi:MAG TPA: hypothetical protein VFD58_09260 [Blastocatellia bacterium]|nr:hypothetical protein [Blastocatellia bacterium]
MLQKAGYKDASALLGGLAAWETAGGEMVKAPIPPPPTPTPTPGVKKAPEAKKQPK